MSKIGKINISIPEKVKVALAGNMLNIEGPSGKKSINIDLEVFNLDIKDGKEISIKPKKIDQETKRLWGMNRSLINNAVIGSSTGYEKTLELVGVGSIDNCAFGGFQLPGYQDGNSIVYKVWKAAEDEVYPAEATYAAGTGTWGELITAVSSLEPVFSVTQSIDVQPFMLNMLSFNVSPDDSDVSSILSDNDVLIVANDAGQYYVPGFSVDQIGSLDLTRALEIFPNGADSQSVVVEGMAMGLDQMI